MDYAELGVSGCSCSYAAADSHRNPTCEVLGGRPGKSNGWIPAGGHDSRGERERQCYKESGNGIKLDYEPKFRQTNLINRQESATGLIYDLLPV
jgi:hypothetical protein